MEIPVEYSDKEPHIKIAYLRKLKGLSQTEFAELLGISQNAYGRVERGETKLTVERTKQIAEVLEVSYESLVGFNPFSIPERILGENGDNAKSLGNIVAKGVVKAALYITILCAESYHAVIQLRKEKNISQSEMAKKLGMSEEMYSKIEAGKDRLTYDKLTQIAKILGTDYESVIRLSSEIITSKHGNKHIASEVLAGDKEMMEDYKEAEEAYRELEEETKNKDIIIKYLESKIKDLEKKIKK